MKLFVLVAVVAVMTLLTAGRPGLGSSVVPTVPRFQQQHLSKRPLPAFEANVGQVSDEARYILRDSNYTLFLTSLEATLVLEEKRVHEQLAALGHRVPTRARLIENGDARATQTEHVVRMRYIGANPQAAIRGIGRLGGTSRYLVGNDPSRWRLDVPRYTSVRYEGLYPGIDLLYHGSDNQLEYDFIVGPGADPNAIRLAFDGEGDREIDSAGDLLLHLADQTLRHRRPILYQDIRGTRVQIQGRYIERHGGEIGFQVGAYDRTRPLVIDPTLAYATYLGGDDDDAGRAIAVDALGQVTVVGLTRSANFPTRNALQGAIGTGESIVFVTKLNAAGTDVVYSTYLGGTSFDRTPPPKDCAVCLKFESVSGIALDPDGNAYITGITFAINFPTTPGAFQRAYHGQGDAYVAKLSASGNLIFATYVGSSRLDWGVGIAVDRTGCSYLTGATDGTDFPTTRTAFQTATSRGLHVFITKLTSDGTALAYSTYLGRETYAYQWGEAITVDACRVHKSDHAARTYS